MITEILGIIAGLFIIVALIHNNIKLIMALDILFIVYGILIGSIQTIILYTFLNGIKIYSISKLKKELK
jgi:predicted membrane protein